MLLVHQAGSVKIGEVVRYTVTYIPSQDRILPSPEKLHLRIRNTSALVLRGAFVHGPYNLCVSAYPSNFNPNEKFREARRYGVPEFEPMIKAASSWDCELTVPEHIRQEAGVGSSSHFGKGPGHESESVSWVIEVASQVIFSSSAAVGFEVIVARDKKSLDMSSSTMSPRNAQPGRVSDHQPLPEEACTIDAAVKKAKADAKARRTRQRAAERQNGERVPRNDSPDSNLDAESAQTQGSEAGNLSEDRDANVSRGIGRKTQDGPTRIPTLSPSLLQGCLAFPLVRDHGEPKAQVKQKLHELSPEARRRPFKVTSISFIGHSLGGLIQTYAIAYCQKHSPEIFDLIRPVNFITLATPFLGLGNENPFEAVAPHLADGACAYGAQKFRNRTVYSNVVNDGIVPLRTSCLLFLDWQGLGRVDKARRDAGLVGTAIGFGWAELTGGSITTARRPELPPDDEEEAAEAGDEVGTEPSGSATPQGEDSHVVPQPSQDARRDATGRDAGRGAGQFSNFFSNLFRTTETPKSPAPPPPPTPTPPPPKSPSQLQSPSPSSMTGPSGKQSLIYRRSQTIKSEESSGVQSTSTGSRVTSGSELGDTDSFVTAPPTTTIFESAHDLINPQVPNLPFLLDPSRRPRAIFHDRVYHPEDIPAPPIKKRISSGLTMRRRMSGGKLVDKESTTSETGQKDHLALRPTRDSGSTAVESDAPSQRSGNDSKGKKQEANKQPPSSMVDGSSMRVEEKIARAYHRDLSWRKVLVKLEPDAHNNIIVRRMFANAFGWPVVHHLVEAHFSDTVTARRLDAEEDNDERARKVRAPPDASGGETRDARPAGRDPDHDTEPELPEARTGNGAREAQRESPQDPALQRTDSETLEAEDSVGDLPTTPTAASMMQTPTASGPRPPWDSPDDGSQSQCSHGSRPGTASGEGRRSVVRCDSMTWSDRDWADSENDSDTEASPTILGVGGSHFGLQHTSTSQEGAVAEEQDADGAQERADGAEPLVFE
ncbi:unnamed protein product [Parascedosporium putredinis]|uniref:DUF676 domain-containing protein n=1 Tax=Parascedosporium putredinis TaxID=1442378 RepID=A0A9P1H6M2_9PEZI|nr:unnamed protein product [Parascedosporium putredinis]CAI7998831.1 unnamed protein product [Parascedosporium putredinis]